MNPFIIGFYIEPLTFKIHCVEEDGEIYILTEKTSIYVEPLENLDDDRFDIEEILQYRDIYVPELNFFNTIFYLRNGRLQLNCYENFEKGNMNPKVLKEYDNHMLTLRKLNDITFAGDNSIKSFIYKDRVHYMIFVYYVITFFNYANKEWDTLFDLFDLKYMRGYNFPNEIMINYDSLTDVQKRLIRSYWQKLVSDNRSHNKI